MNSTGGIGTSSRSTTVQPYHKMGAHRSDVSRSDDQVIQQGKSSGCGSSARKICYHARSARIVAEAGRENCQQSIQDDEKSQ